jgi:GNAT superfamily N-acetyltransferase
MTTPSHLFNGDAASEVRIVRGYRTGLIGQVVAMHAETYDRWASFGRTFEAKVATELAEFIGRLDRPVNAIWHAEHEGSIVGNIAIDGEDLGDGRAHLRWFIVSPTYQGAGLGKALLDSALAFVDQAPFDATKLWTLKGLEAARLIYDERRLRSRS